MMHNKLYIISQRKDKTKREMREKVEEMTEMNRDRNLEIMKKKIQKPKTNRKTLQYLRIAKTGVYILIYTGVYITY